MAWRLGCAAQEARIHGSGSAESMARRGRGGKGGRAPTWFVLRANSLRAESHRVFQGETLLQATEGFKAIRGNFAEALRLQTPRLLTCICMRLRPKPLPSCPQHHTWTNFWTVSARRGRPSQVSQVRVTGSRLTKGMPGLRSKPARIKQRAGRCHKG
eukprot:224337-Chlamydomonas_euryale.AAC.5